MCLIITKPICKHSCCHFCLPAAIRESGEIDVSKIVHRLNPRCLVKEGFCFIEAVLEQERVSQIVQQVGVMWKLLQRTPVVSLGLSVPSFSIRNDRQAVMSLRMIRGAVQNLLKKRSRGLLSSGLEFCKCGLQLLITCRFGP